ncbi:hypothetical protein R1flu_015171 [Riccia fluitans]|uniref:DDE Tnp4 domain-containing protein n=1 Tax=Riccia fluitans TaxID=41844 RepID=A0ABD1YII6_9MARC
MQGLQVKRQDQQQVVDISYQYWQRKLDGHLQRSVWNWDEGWRIFQAALVLSMAHCAKFGDRSTILNMGNGSMGGKKTYCLNNIVIVDHNGLFIFIDSGYPGSYHDVNCLRNSTLFQHWRDYFTHNDREVEFVLGDPGYAGVDMFIMR